MGGQRGQTAPGASHKEAPPALVSYSVPHSLYDKFLLPGGGGALNADFAPGDSKSTSVPVLNTDMRGDGCMEYVTRNIFS